MAAYLKPGSQVLSARIICLAGSGTVGLQTCLAPSAFGPSPRNYSVCQKFVPFASFQIPLNPPLSKEDFNRNSGKFPPFLKGGRGDLSDAAIGKYFWQTL